MPDYSETSRARLSSCHRVLRVLFRRVLPYFDHTILEGYRSPERQDHLFQTGASKLPSSSPKAKHCKNPSWAVDAGPWVPGKGVVWNVRACAYFAGFVMREFELMRFEAELREEAFPFDLRWGGDWDRDRDVTDQDFNDLVHFELVLKKEGPSHGDDC